MVTGIIGRKVGMTQVYDGEGNLHAVTVIEAGPCTVLAVRTKDRDAGGSAGGDGAATKHEGETIDRLLQQRRLGLGIGLAEIP